MTSGLIIDTDKLTIADVFKHRGYATAALGKWHLGFGEGTNDWQEPLRPGPQDLGFDYYFGLPVVNSAPPYVYVENDRIVGGDPADPLIYLGRGRMKRQHRSQKSRRGLSAHSEYVQRSGGSSQELQ